MRLGTQQVKLQGNRQEVALPGWSELELELELVQSHMTQKPVLRGEVGACRFMQLTSTAKR